MPWLVYLSALWSPLGSFHDLPKFPIFCSLGLPSRYTPHQKSKHKRNKGTILIFFNLLNAFYLYFICECHSNFIVLKSNYKFYYYEMLIKQTNKTKFFV